MFPLFGSLLALSAAQLTSASLYVTFPVKGSTCPVNQPCQVKWQDSPDPPALSALGETSIDLVAGDPSSLRLVQALGGVSDPSQAKALTFTPAANISSKDQYAIRFTPKKNPTGVIFSAYFNITGGSASASANSTSMNASTAANTSSATSSSSVALSSASHTPTALSSSNNTAATSAKSASSALLASLPLLSAAVASSVAYFSC